MLFSTRSSEGDETHVWSYVFQIDSSTVERRNTCSSKDIEDIQHDPILCRNTIWMDMLGRNSMGHDLV